VFNSGVTVGCYPLLYPNGSNVNWWRNIYTIDVGSIIVDKLTCINNNDVNEYVDYDDFELYYSIEEDVRLIHIKNSNKVNIINSLQASDNNKSQGVVYIKDIIAICFVNMRFNKNSG
jgi:hypothetical protein